MTTKKINLRDRQELDSLDSILHSLKIKTKLPPGDIILTALEYYNECLEGRR